MPKNRCISNYSLIWFSVTFSLFLLVLRFWFIIVIMYNGFRSNDFLMQNRDKYVTGTTE